MEQKKDRISKSRTRNTFDSIDSFIRTVRRRRESSAKLNLPLLPTPTHLLPLNFPSDEDLVREIRLENRRLYHICKRNEGFRSAKVADAIWNTSTNMYLNWKYDGPLSLLFLSFLFPSLLSIGFSLDN
jgi:hypothetical protein